MSEAEELEAHEIGHAIAKVKSIDNDFNGNDKVENAIHTLAAVILLTGQRIIDELDALNRRGN